MAEVNDAEIKIGVNVDADKFLSEYEVLLNKVGAKTKEYMSSTLEKVSGAATKDWGEFPFAKMHDKTAGAQITEKAFLGSLAKDLETQGIKPKTLGFQSALLNASNIVSTPDPWQRFHQMLASGLTQQADITHPDTMLGKTISSDYELMKQPWARDFVKKSKKGQYVDFEGMRNYAVDAGLGKWIDEDKEHTSDNFELINKELEDIEENSDKADSIFKNWGEDLKGALGTLTAIGSTLAKLGLAALGTAVAVTEKSEKGVYEAAGTLDRRRAYVGMSALDELAAQVASQSVGLGKDAITNEIINMSSNREKYQLLGEGLNALYPSLTGIFDNIMSSENPMDTYKSILKEVYDNMRGADQDTRAQTLMLLESQGLGSAAQIIGAMLSNEGLAAQLGHDPTALFSLKSNAYYGSYEKAESMLPDLVKLNESLQASYTQLYTDFTEYFGKPFKEWWDAVLKEKVIPWFEKFIEFTGVGKSDAWKTVDETYAEIALLVGIQGQKNGGLTLRNKAIKDAEDSELAYSGYLIPRQLYLGNADWNAKLAGDMFQKSGGKAKSVWKDYLAIAAESTVGMTGTAKDTQARIDYMTKRIKETGLDTFLENSANERVDKYLLEALQTGAIGDEGWQKTFDDYINKVLGIGAEGDIYNKILAVLEDIAGNTATREELFKKDDLWLIIENVYGAETANAWKAMLRQ